MKQGFGLPVFPGVAIGPAVVYRKAQRTLPVSSGDPALEQAKFNSALDTAREQLTALYEKAKVEIGEEQAAIVEVQLLMLDDLDYLDGVTMAIEGGASAAIAALDTGDTMKNSQKSLFQHTDNQCINKRPAEIVLAKKFGNKGYLPITLQ